MGNSFLTAGPGYSGPARYVSGDVGVYRSVARTSDRFNFSAARGVTGLPDQNGAWQLIDGAGNRAGGGRRVGHLIARQTGIPYFQTWSAGMSPLPFTVKYRPRLISALRPLGFSPNGDGRGDVWTPQSDITKPMRSVTLKSQQGAKTVAQLDGTAPDGSGLDLKWDGLSARGIQVPEGMYQWTLAGRSADGDGTLISDKGRPRSPGRSSSSTDEKRAGGLPAISPFRSCEGDPDGT
ncbi:hypothetical protein GCM10022223_42940 [Kineosporia mesophila]|uniref:FlgD Ig-like domain-containing protein n=1 Tax=Kineosporia mesophila TaxID=566012 RepID=A0ABP7A191_9ACTN|nr:gliding motility-associated C-terminal domain-containing protein [Kineosporia mesophila]MCD5353267.1 gliding motility-associated C-terminal domain-containing protein [Kineosporia mesophila]